MAEHDELQALVARASRILGKLDLTKSTSGHVSARIDGTDTFLIRARGPGETGVRYTQPDDVTWCWVQLICLKAECQRLNASC